MKFSRPLLIIPEWQIVQKELHALMKTDLAKVGSVVIMESLPPQELPDSVKELVESLDLSVDNCKFWITGVGVKNIVHTDGLNRICALNFPIVNCEQAGPVQWFDRPLNPCLIRRGTESRYDLRLAYPTDVISDGPTPDQISRESEVSMIYTKDWVPSEQVFMNRPILIHTDVWHSVDNTQNDKVRVVFTIRFKGNPSFEEVSDRLWEVNL